MLYYCFYLNYILEWGFIIFSLLRASQKSWCLKPESFLIWVVSGVISLREHGLGGRASLGFLPLLGLALSEGKGMIRLVRDWQLGSLLERLHKANSYSSAQVRWSGLSQ